MQISGSTAAQPRLPGASGSAFPQTRLNNNLPVNHFEAPGNPDRQPGGTKVTTGGKLPSCSLHDIMPAQQLWTASFVSGKMRPLPLDFWGFWPRQLLAGLAILLAAAVLSVVLFPAGHGSFVSTHGPAATFRSRRAFLALRWWLAAVVATLASFFCAQRPRLRALHYARRQVFHLNLPEVSSRSVVLLC